MTTALATREEPQTAPPGDAGKLTCSSIAASFPAPVSLTPQEERAIDEWLLLDPPWSKTRIAHILNINRRKITERKKELSLIHPQLLKVSRKPGRATLSAALSKAMGEGEDQSDAYFMAAFGLTEKQVKQARIRAAHYAQIDAVLIRDPASSDSGTAQELGIPGPLVRRRRSELEAQGVIAPQPLRRKIDGTWQRVPSPQEVSNAELELSIRAHPHFSNRRLSEVTGVCRKRITALRIRLEDDGIIELHGARLGRDGSRHRITAPGNSAEPPPGTPRKIPRSTTVIRAEIEAVLAAHPHLSNVQIARAAGVGLCSVQRHRPRDSPRAAQEHKAWQRRSPSEITALLKPILEANPHLTDRQVAGAAGIGIPSVQRYRSDLNPETSEPRSPNGPS